MLSPLQAYTHHLAIQRNALCHFRTLLCSQKLYVCVCGGAIDMGVHVYVWVRRFGQTQIQKSGQNLANNGACECFVLTGIHVTPFLRGIWGAGLCARVCVRAYLRVCVRICTCGHVYVCIQMR